MKKFISAVLSMAIFASVSAVPTGVSVQAASDAKQMEYLSRGLTAVKIDGGVYLSWRILGTESLSQQYDIYRDGVKIATVDACNYTDTSGFLYNNYNVVRTGETPKLSEQAEVWRNNYIDIPVDRPSGGTTKSGEAYTYSINDTTVGDVDGDGEYEYIIKWDPSNSKDNSSHGYTGNVLIDCYELDGTKLWRIDMGINIRAGAHYTQISVYDFDGDGKAEMALRTRPGSKDGNGNYVSAAGENLTWDGYNDSSDLRQNGSKSGHIIKGPDWLTMFNGETGAAMQTIDYYPQRGSVKSWGDSYGGRSERFLAGVAYLNGQTPSLIMCRGYYEKASMAAYNWDGESFTQLWGKTYTSDTSTLYAQGNHQLSVADVDNDGKDEIVFGSAVMDDTGEVLNSTKHGHGDALHVSDFNNDGEQEIFQVHEEKTYYKTYGAEVRKGKNAQVIGATGASADCGRGVMANVDDAYALANPDTAPSLYWSVADGYAHGIDGSIITKTREDGDVYASLPREINSFVYWDGDLGRELLDYTRVVKYTIGDDAVDAYSTRLATFEGVHNNNSTKANAALSADLFGDWREEIAYGTNDNKALRIFTTTIPTDYKLTTLMHDSQYRCGVAWQNVGYNQPPHTSYYIGSLALASGKNYLSPAAGFDAVGYANTPTADEPVPDTEESVIYTAESFDNGKAGFTSGSVITQSAPYNNVLSLSSGSVSFEVSTPDSNATPTPTPSPTPAPTPVVAVIPTEKPQTVYSNGFESGITADDKNRIIYINTSEEKTVYNEIDGIKLAVGVRETGSKAETNWSWVEGGRSGKALMLNSNEYANANRGPRIVFTTPAIASGSTAELSINVKLYKGGDTEPKLNYNDSESSDTSTDISSYFSTSEYRTLRVEITYNGASFERTIYCNDTVIATDNVGTFPVLRGVIPTDSGAANTGVYFDDFSVTISEIPFETGIYAKNVNITSTNATAEVYNYDEAKTVSLYFAQYNSDNTLKSVKVSSAEIPSGSYAVYNVDTTAGDYGKVFIWDGNSMQPIEINDTADVSIASAVVNTDGTYLVEFDWRPGTSVKLTDTNGANLVTLSKTSSTAIKYTTGTNEAKTLNAMFTTSSNWYHVEITLDFTAKAADIAVMDYTGNSETKTVYSQSFNGSDGFLSKLTVSGSTYLDNLVVSELKYNVDMSLVNFGVTDNDGEAVADATVTIGSRQLTTDSDGHAAIKLKSGTYDYSITKAAYKSAKGTLTLANGVGENVSAVIADGEMRTIYVSYVYDGQIQLADPVWAGEAMENTTYTVTDEAKGDITYTFPTDSEDIVPGYEDYAGQTYTFEYDSDGSETVDVTVDEGADTYIVLAYKIKRVPTETDTAVTRVLFNEDGVGLSQISGSGEYVVNDETGEKYTRYSLTSSKTVSVSIPNTSAAVVLEMDVMYESIDSGGNVYGVCEYSGTTKGTGIGLRTTGDGSQWSPVKWGKEQWVSTTNNYKYPANYQNRWTHIIMVSTGTDIRVTMADKETGTVYVDNQSIGMTNSVGSASKPINKLVFGCGYGSGNAVMSVKEVKAYTVGVAADAEMAEETVQIQPTDTYTFTVEEHISDVEGVNFDVSDIIGVSYELCDASNNTVSPDGFSLSEDGVLTTSLDDFEDVEQYYVIVKYNDIPVKRITLDYLTVTYTYGTIKGFGDGTSPFTITSASGYSISQENETLCYTRTAGTAYNNSVLLTAPLWTGALADDFVFSFDYMVDEAFYKGYMYVTDGSGNEMIRMETHVYQPRIKIFHDSSGTLTNFNSSYGFAKDTWYTFVVRGNNFTSGSKSLSMEIYKQGEYDYTTDTASGTPLVTVTDMTPYNSSCTSTGISLKYQVAQNTGSSDTDAGDKQYFDNLAYYYYDYK